LREFDAPTAGGRVVWEDGIFVAIQLGRTSAVRWGSNLSSWAYMAGSILNCSGETGGDVEYAAGAKVKEETRGIDSAPRAASDAKN